MSEFPASHTTTTAAPPPAYSSSNGRPFFDVTMAKSVPGLLKIAQIINCFLAFCICVSVLDYSGKAGWSSFTAFIGFVGALAFFFLVVFHVVDMLPKFPWELAEMVFYGIWTFFFFISFICMCVVASWGYQRATAGAGAFFLLVCMVLFALDTFLKYRAWRGTVTGAPPAPQPPA